MPGTPEVVVIDPASGIFWHGLIDPPPTWLATALIRWWVILYVGGVGLPDGPAGDTDAALAAVTRAAGAGRLVGSRIGFGISDAVRPQVRRPEDCSLNSSSSKLEFRCRVALVTMRHVNELDF